MMHRVLFIKVQTPGSEMKSPMMIHSVCVSAPWRLKNSLADCVLPVFALRGWQCQQNTLFFTSLSFFQQFLYAKNCVPLPTVSHHSTTWLFVHETHPLSHTHNSWSPPQRWWQKCKHLHLASSTPESYNNLKKKHFTQKTSHSSVARPCFLPTLWCDLWPILEIFQHYGWHSWSLTRGSPVAGSFRKHDTPTQATQQSAPCLDFWSRNVQINKSTGNDIETWKSGKLSVDRSRLTESTNSGVFLGSNE